MALACLIGCGKAAPSSTTSDVTLTATVTLPSSASGSLSALSVQKAATADEEETPQAGKTCVFYDGDQDVSLGQAETGSDGVCTVASSLAEGERNVFVQVLEGNETEIAGSMISATVSSATSDIDMTVNTGQDLAFQAWKAACATSLGEECVLGHNTGAGIAQVVPDCILNAFTGLEETNETEDVAGNYIRALKEAHKSNLAQAVGTGGAPPIDMACVLKGDADCQQALEDAIGTSVSTLAIRGKAIQTSEAASTSASILEKIVESLCGDPEGYALLKADNVFQEDPTAPFRIFAALKPAEISQADSDSLNKLITQAPAGLSQGVGFFSDMNKARAMVELALNQQITSSQTDAEIANRMAVLEGAGSFANFSEAATRVRAAANIYAATTWSDVTAPANARQVGALLQNSDQTTNMITGGVTGVNQLFENVGGFSAYRNFFDSRGTGADAVSQFMTIYKQKGAGESCAATSDCLPPGLCSGSKCEIAGVNTALTGGPGTACTANAQCAQDKGFGCDGLGHVCVYLASQASGNFGIDGGTFTLPTTGSLGAPCGTDTDCREGRVCLQGGCFERPSSLTGGLQTGGSCTRNDQCASGYCTSSFCTVVNTGSGGQPTVTTLATGVSGIANLGIQFLCDTSACFFIQNSTSSTTGKISKIPVSGGSVTDLATGLNQPTALDLTSTNVCWGEPHPESPTHLYCVPKTGGNTTTVVTSVTGVTSVANGLVNNGTSFFWARGESADGVIQSIAVSSSGATDSGRPAPWTNLASSLDTPVRGLIQGSNYYFLQRNPKTKISKISTSGGSVTDLTTTTLAIQSYASDGTNLCWTEGTAGQSDGKVKCMSLGGGAVTTVASGLPYPQDIALSGGYAYVAIQGIMSGQTMVAPGSVIKVPIAGGTATTLVSETNGSYVEIEVVGSNVYFTRSDTQSSARIQTIPQ